MKSDFAVQAIKKSGKSDVALGDMLRVQVWFAKFLKASGQYCFAHVNTLPLVKMPFTSEAGVINDMLQRCFQSKSCCRQTKTAEDYKKKCL